MAALESQNDLVTDLLLNPDTYRGLDASSEVETRETHISRVFLTDRFAFKMKKHVQFDFLDYSTLDLREKACRDELELNRRLAPDVYLSVLPVCQNRWGRLSIDDGGETIEWLVKMKRLSDSSSLANLIIDGHLRPSHVRDLSKMLAHFYTRQAPQTTKSLDFRLQITQHVESNRADLLEHATEHSHSIDKSTFAQLRFLRLQPDLFDMRVCDGRIVDGHGDLRPEHVYFAPFPIVIDCIEFNAEFRRNDIADELGFLAMECDRLGAGSVGEQIIDTYCELSHDDVPPNLLSFYKCYRACVRAKVSAYKTTQLPPPNRKSYREVVISYLRAAQTYAEQIAPSLVISVGGRIGTGKSTLAHELAKQLHAELTQTDVIRSEQLEPHEERRELGTDKYSETNRNRVYELMFARVRDLLKRNPTVILDGTFSKDALRVRALESATSASAVHIHIECTCPREVSIERIRSRLANGRSHSEAKPETYDRQHAEYEPISGPNSHAIDTTLPINVQTQLVLDVIASTPMFGLRNTT